MATHQRTSRQRVLAVAALGLTAASLGGCGKFQGGMDASTRLTERECLARVMYFESIRSSDEGMLAVGTVVMNRLQSPKYPKTVCGVIGQEKQFADGALTKRVERPSASWTRAERVADAVLAGERHDGVGQAQFFHTAGYKFPYRNMKYVTLAGGNIFYDKRYPEPGQPSWPSASQFAANHKKDTGGSRIMLARADIAAREGSGNDDDRFEAAPRTAPSRVPREAPRPVLLAKAEIPSFSANDASDEDDAPVAALPTRPKAPVVAAPKPQPLVLARREAPSTFDIDEEDDEAPAKAPLPKAVPRPAPPAAIATKPQPVVLARAPSRIAPSRADQDEDDVPVLKAKSPAQPAKPQPIVVAAAQPSASGKWRPADIAATLRAAPPSHAAPAHLAGKTVLAVDPAPPRADKARPVLVSAMQPPTKPKPVVLAMLNDKARPLPPKRGIADLIAQSNEGKRPAAKRSGT